MKTSSTQYHTLVIVLLSQPVLAEDYFSAVCKEFSECVQYISKRTGQRYLYQEGIKTKVRSSDNLEINAQNAELLFSKMLDFNQLTRVPIEENTFAIMTQREARDRDIPIYPVSSSASLPNAVNYDLATMRYALKHGELAEPLARTIRSFVPAAARIIPDSISGSLMVTDTMKNLEKVVQVIQYADHNPSKEYLKSLKDGSWKKNRPGTEVTRPEAKKEVQNR